MIARIWTGLIGAAVFLSAVFLGGFWFQGFMLAICIVGFLELLQMRKINLLSLPAIIGWLVAAAACLQGTRLMLQPIWFMLLMLIFLVVPVVSKNRFQFADSSFIWFGSLWIGLSVNTLIQIRLTPVEGIWYFLYVILSIWATDIGAYFIGRWLKGPKIWPAISPNKTVSGTIGGLFSAFVIGILFYFWIHSGLRLNIPSKGILEWGVLSVVLSIAGQLGDFAESALKRSYNVKDSGSLLPGHGGILDRFDSLLVAGPVAYYATVIGFQLWG